MPARKSRNHASGLARLMLVSRCRAIGQFCHYRNDRTRRQVTVFLAGFTGVDAVYFENYL